MAVSNRDFLGSLHPDESRLEYSFSEPLADRASLGHFDRSGSHRRPFFSLIAAQKVPDLEDCKRGPIELLQFFTSLIVDSVKGEVPLLVFESATANGERLSSLSLGARVALRWRLCEAAYSLGWSVADVIVLADTSSAIRTLFEEDQRALREVIANAWVVILASRHRDLLPPCAISSLDLAERDDVKALQEAPDLLLRSSDRRLAVHAAGMTIDGEYFQSPPVISVDPVMEFVQTGWTHQRVDGGPDLRFSHNPPIGYDRIVGYDLSINGRKARQKSNPERFVRLITAYWDFLAGTIRTKRAQFADASPTGSASVLLAPVTARCSHCRKTLRFRTGTFAQPLKDAPAGI